MSHQPEDREGAPEDVRAPITKLSEEIPDITEDEIRYAVLKMKSNKPFSLTAYQ